MIECPWCSHRVILTADNLCPYCKHEVLPEHLDPAYIEGEAAQEEAFSQGELSVEALDIAERIANRFRCARCGHEECRVEEAAMTGTGLSKMFDIQYKHYLFVSCLNCGSVDVYDPDILRSHPSGRLGTILDGLFGG